MAASPASASAASMSAWRHRYGRSCARWSTPWSSCPSMSGATSSVATPAWTAAARSGLEVRAASGPTITVGRRDGISLRPWLASSSARAAARYSSEKPVPLGEEMRPWGSRRITATRSAPKRTRVWSPRSRSTSPTSRREARSVATRRRASDRRRRPLACSVMTEPWTRTPRMRAIAPARRLPSSGPRDTAPASTSTPHGPSTPGIATASSSVPMPRTVRGPGRPGRAWTGSSDSSATVRTFRPGGTLRVAVVPEPSTSTARGTRPPGRSSHTPTSAAPVAARIRRQAASNDASRPVACAAIPARSASRSSPAGRSETGSCEASRRPRRVARTGPRSADGDGPDSAAARKRWRSVRRYRRSPRTFMRKYRSRPASLHARTVFAWTPRICAALATVRVASPGREFSVAPIGVWDLAGMSVVSDYPGLHSSCQ